LEKDDLQSIIDQIESNTSKDDAYFGIFEYGGGPDESCIRANRSGLELYAVNLLKASRDFDEIIKDKDREPNYLNLNDTWIDNSSQTMIQYIDPVVHFDKKVNEDSYKETWKDKSIKTGCIVGITIVAASIIIGLITMISWIFD